MKLLAIRGENLASLAGPFEVLLDQAPLGGSGLFAITGVTGAGKSTLLDALCLALFDKMPRLDAQPRALVGRTEEDRLPINDVRTILRRGTAAGFAEVEYRGRDGQRYRARWSVRRAREKIDGQYQAQEMTLTDATGKSLGRNKTEVLAEIMRTLGLSYPQFRRSALLAQGDFAAFLRANADDRASLLEQMTGTELYTELSKAAFRRNKEVQEALRQLDAAIGAVATLSAEERAAREASLAVLDAERQRAKEALDALDEARRWYEERASRAAKEGAAIEEERRAGEAWDAGAEERARLAQVEQARGLRPLRDEEASAREALAKGLARHGELVALARAAQDAHAEATGALAGCARALAEAREALAAKEPALESARIKDGAIVEAERRCEEATAIVAATERARDEARRAVTAQDEVIAAASARAGTIAAWLAARPVHAALAEQWPRWEAALARHAESARGARSAEATQETLTPGLARAEAALALATGEAAAAEEARQAAESAYRASEEEAQRAATTPERKEERDQILADRQRLVALEAVVAQAIDRAAAERREREAEAFARAATERAKAAAIEAETQALVLGAKHEEAERAAKRLRAVQDVVSHRAELREGEACPLCGAREHPYASDGWPLAQEASAQETHAAALRDQVNAAQRDAATAQAESRAGEAQALASAQRAREARDELTRFGERWVRDAAVLGLSSLAPDEAARDEVRGALASRDRRLLAIDEAERISVALAKAAKAKLVESESRREAHEIARTKRDDAERAAIEVRRRIEENRALLARFHEARAQAAEELEAPLAQGKNGWRDKLAAQPERFAEECAKAVSEHQARVAERAAIEETLAQARTERASAAALAEERTATVEAQAAALAQRIAALAALRIERAALLDGRAVVAVRGALDARIAQADAALGLARERERVTATAEASALSEARSAEASVAERRAAEEGAAVALDGALAAIGIDRATLASLLAPDDRWIEATRAAITAREQALLTARAIRGERARAREDHEASGRPAVDEGAARDGIEPARVELDRATQASANARAALQSDDEARRQRADKAEELAARQRLAERWKAMDDLIGSADGKKFKVFAQSLTLEALLSHANEHLNELSPRYRLMRVPGHDLDLQIVDQDMAEEIRSTSSLSGGESFLVSLALALGLSSLAAHDVRIETLFIDEGFGSLDPETLDMAIAALETLQAAGRQIGLISHVSGLAEQIGVEVRVERQGGGRSRVRVTGEGTPSLSTDVLAGPAKVTPARVTAKKRAKKASGSAA